MIHICMQANCGHRCKNKPCHLSLQVTLKEFDTLDLQMLKTPSDYTAASKSSETIDKMEECMEVWMEQIEQVTFRQSYELSFKLKRSIKKVKFQTQEPL